MRVVFDTNALLGAARFPEGNAGSVFQECVWKGVRVFVSHHILEEMKKALRDDFSFQEREVQETMRVIEKTLRVVQATAVSVKGISVPDRLVLGTCLAAEADYLVTYDSDLLALKRFRHTRIVRPEELRKTLFKQGSYL